MGIDPRIEDLECVCRSYIYGDAPLAFFSRHLNRSAERAEILRSQRGRPCVTFSKTKLTGS